MRVRIENSRVYIDGKEVNAEVLLRFSPGEKAQLTLTGEVGFECETMSNKELLSLVEERLSDKEFLEALKVSMNRYKQSKATDSKFKANM